MRTILATTAIMLGVAGFGVPLALAASVLWDPGLSLLLPTEAGPDDPVLNVLAWAALVLAPFLLTGGLLSLQRSERGRGLVIIWLLCLSLVTLPLLGVGLLLLPPLLLGILLPNLRQASAGDLSVGSER